jgi:hypothetical protein
MLKNWTFHSEYQKFFIDKISDIYKTDAAKVEFYSKSLLKLYNANLDSLYSTISHTYPNFGRPAKNQDVIFRSFLLSSSLGFNSIKNWIPFLKSDKLLCFAIGVFPKDVPAVSNHYDFINRLWLGCSTPKNTLRPVIRKPRKKLGKNQKQPPRHPGIIAKLAKIANSGRTLKLRPERLLQQVFANCCVAPSALLGLLGDVSVLDVVADGTCLKTGANKFGKKVCNCQKQGILGCTCNRKYSDVDANWGWDSHNEQWFYGYTEYIVSVCNKELKVDLPIYLRTVQASRFDGVSGIVALSELLELYPHFNFNSFIADTAHDNYPTYELLNNLDITPIIPISKNNNSKLPNRQFQFDENGIPICKCGRKLFFWGSIKKEHRLKWRCPIKCLKKQLPCEFESICNTSDYGLTYYTKPSWDFRVFTKIPRNTHTWHMLYNKRTASERVNDKLLVDHKLEQSHTRGKKRFSFWSLIHSFDIHLNAWIKCLPKLTNNFKVKIADLLFVE